MKVSSPATSPATLAAWTLYFLRLGALGFGGPIALIARMERDLVVARAWVTREAFLEGLALAQLAPGPLAAQLAIYLGWLRAGTLGATLAGIAFVLPSFVIVMALAALYLRHGGLPWMQALFYGIGAAAIALIARGSIKLARSALRADPWLWAVAAANAAVTALTGRELVSVFIGSGVAMLLVRRALPRSVATSAPAFVALSPQIAGGLHGVATNATLLELGAYFTAAGAFVFGSGLAIVPFLHGGVVVDHGWLTESQFLDAVAVAMITPGPVVIAVAFIGYLVAGPAGAGVAAAGVFVPCYLAVLVLAPIYRRVSADPTLRAFVAGVTAASCGALAGAVVVLGRRSIHDPGTLAIALGAAILLWRAPRLPEPLVLAGAGAAGLFLR